jgi:pyruvate dehydrogenase E2 component (dihydrolipoamide acetyltransferase)
MPKLTDSMEEGIIIAWLKTDGEHVDEGDDLLEIETDKATMTVQAEASGVLEILVPEGTSLPAGAIIGRLGSSSQRVLNDATAREPPAAVEASVAAALSDASPVDSSGVVLGSATAEPVNGDLHRSGGTTRATPLARRIAATHGIELKLVRGSGPLGRITRADVLREAGVVEAASPQASSSPVPAIAPMPAAAAATTTTMADGTGAGAKGDVKIIEPTRLQGVIARRMAEAKATIPHFQVQTDVEMDAVIAFRAQLKGCSAEVVPSFNDLIVKAAALALRAYPLANGSYRDGRFECYSRVNIGIAVAGNDALVVPTIFDADQKSLGAIAAEARRLAARVREGTISPPELSGATFTVSNLGMYGMAAITPVINAPQAAILGVGATRAVLARRDGEIVDRNFMTLTLSCDHRILYGATAAALMSDIRDRLERPLGLAL